MSARVSVARLNTETYIGDNKTDSGPDSVQVTSRSQQNYAENVPLALLLGAVVELNGGNRKALTGGFAALLLFRILHVELGLRAKDTMGPGRSIGHTGTLGFVMGMAGYAAYLVKGYWGM